MLDRLVAEARERWGLDVMSGIQVVPADGLTALPIEASVPLLIVPAATLAGSPDVGTRQPSAVARAPLPGRHGPLGREPLAVLRRLYSPEAIAIRLGREAEDEAASTTVGALVADDLAGPLFLPGVPPELAAAGPWAMPYISHRLRQPDGCPWDREQTHESLRKHLLEETYEVYDALEAGATPALAEELGDLLLQVVLHAQLAAEAGVFDLADVQASLARKIVRRHPHVFGDAVARTAADVNRQWERIKAGEREAAADSSDAVAPKGALDGISPSMPALAASQEMQERAAAIGYDWPSIEGVLDKVAEELAELARAETDEDRAEEFGDLLLVAVNVGRKLGIESEAALRAANAKFKARFGRVERMARERHVVLRDLDFAALDDLWDAAKAEERSADAERRPAATREGAR